MKDTIADAWDKLSKKMSYAKSWMEKIFKWQEILYGIMWITIIIAKQVGYLLDDEIFNKIDSIRKMLLGLINFLRNGG